MGHQREDQADRLGGRAQARRRACGRGEGLVALLADQALFLARVNANVALALLPSGGAVQIGTKCGGEVHAASSWR